MKFKLLFIALFNLAFLLNFSCKNATQFNYQQKVEKYNKTTHVVCSKDTTQTYELYVPLFRPSEKLPVIYLFDPHADGKLAIESCKKAAEMFGFILVASNNSKNGINGLDNILNVLVNEANEKLPVDPERQYAAGFSGGGRAAGYLASINPKIKGIITCGAGFSPNNSFHKFDVYAIAGKEDFNYFEVLSSSKQLQELNWTITASFFNGGHQWPPSEEINDAVLWLQLNAMRREVLPRDKKFLIFQEDSFLLRAELLVAKNQLLEAADECEKGISFLSNLIDTKQLENKLSELKTSANYIHQEEKRNRILSFEQRLRNAYVQAFNEKDLHWWKKEIDTLNQKIEVETDLITMQMFKRTKALLGILCFSNSSNAVRENNMKNLEKALGIYKLVEPKNPDCFFYQAVFFDKNHQVSDAKAAYKNALEHGFLDKAKAKVMLSSNVLQ